VCADDLLLRCTVRRSKRESFVSHLEGLVWRIAPNAGKFSGVCCRFGRACLFPALSVVFCRIVAYALAHLRRCVYM